MNFIVSKDHALDQGTYIIGVVWLHNKCVQVSENIILTTNIFLNEEILAFVIEDNVNFLGTWSTNVRPWGK